MTDMNYMEINQRLLHFIDKSPVSYFAVQNMQQELEDHGACRLFEGDHWELCPGSMYYVTRNGSSLIAFRIPKEGYAGFQIMASHSDSPCFRIKTNAEIEIDRRYIELNVEKYGGMLCESWFDRPLSVAGRILVRTMEGVETRLVLVDRDLMIIPHLAIHMNRDVNNGYKINVQKDMLPLLGDAGEESAGSLLRLIAQEAGIDPGSILDTDLYLYNRMRGTILGKDGEYIASGRLDDLQCAYSSLQGFLAAEPGESIAVHCVFDNEEVGSGTRQGAGSPFLSDTLRRIHKALGGTEEGYFRVMQSSLMVSADNAHAVHPSHPEKADPLNRPYLNGGIVLKYSSDQKYTTDAVSGALFREICRLADVPLQVFHNRSDLQGGSTLGHISLSHVAVNSVDIGLPQLAMHSCYETAGSRDTMYLINAARVLFSSAIKGRGDGRYRLHYKSL